MYVADYVLMEYGTGAIMAVPAPRRARLRRSPVAYDLPIRQVVAPPDGEAPADEAFVAHTDDEPMVNSGRFDGTHDRGRAYEQIDRLAAAPRAAATRSVNYRLRDWLLSRQRYWGCPIPIVYCDDLRHGAGARGRAARRAARRRGLPAARALAAGRRRGLGATRRCPACGGPARRETDTMDTFVDSSWYFLRYCDARNDEAPWDPRGPGASGCRSTSTSAASSTRSCTCCTRASSSRRSPTWSCSSVQEPFAAAVHAGDDPRPRRRRRCPSRAAT